MKSRRTAALRRELRAAGAKPAEIDSLTAVATQLRELAPRALPTRLLPFGLTTAAGVALGAWLIIAAQTVLPGSPLYAVQKFSDNVAVAMHPAYRGTVMMRRAGQIKTLVAAKAPAGQFSAALADYHAVAASYKFGSANYDVLEFCKADLAEAARQAPPSEQKALTATLASLQTV